MEAATHHHILLAEPGPAALSSAAALRGAFRVTCAETGTEAVELLSRDRPDGALIATKLPVLSSFEVAEYALSHNVPVVMLANPDDDLAQIEQAGCPYVLKPLPEAKLIATARFLLLHAAENIARAKAARDRFRSTRDELRNTREGLRATRDELSVLIARARKIEAHAMADRTERLRRSGLSPRAARAPSLLDDWDVIRAAQHMIEMHAARATATAELRAERALDLNIAKRWRAIAKAIQEIQSGRG